jgi:hypothetical protein
MTTYELAKLLLEQPNIPVKIEVIEGCEDDISTVIKEVIYLDAHDDYIELLTD